MPKHFALTNLFSDDEIRELEMKKELERQAAKALRQHQHRQREREMYEVGKLISNT